MRRQAIAMKPLTLNKIKELNATLDKMKADENNNE